jgi:hypothetical protein
LNSAKFLEKKKPVVASSPEAPAQVSPTAEVTEAQPVEIKEP